MQNFLGALPCWPCIRLTAWRKEFGYFLSHDERSPRPSQCTCQGLLMLCQWGHLDFPQILILTFAALNLYIMIQLMAQCHVLGECVSSHDVSDVSRWPAVQTPRPPQTAPAANRAWALRGFCMRWVSRACQNKSTPAHDLSGTQISVHVL